MTATAEVTKSKSAETREDKTLVQRVTWKLMSGNALMGLTQREVASVFWAINTLSDSRRDDDLKDRARNELNGILAREL